ncbi:tetratricopeptide repeat protein [Streptomyces sp. YS415]|uniref:tetratricopeptide repeat protein n=1 Tax=Streptomyces sp. YS415 TaxID=2944806 RepID=UPI00202040D7|nr:tetratricopeptide repeat protein [Streptomyces sp. YS415]MCL7427082.1 tetratricopeptide repeat protein [Streptomyces sp. YS415]
MAVVTPVASVGVVVGMGGVGKTQLAAHYARSLWRSVQLDVLVWITAATGGAVVEGYAAAAAEIVGIDEIDPARAAAMFLAWLEPKAGQKPCRWLVVLDDVSDPADMDGWWPPASPTGRVLVTTRRQDAALTTGRRHIPVGVFTPGESLAYLTHALPPSEAPAQLAALAQDLGHLPLALSQAAAYLTDTTTPVAEYRQLLRSRTQLCDAAPDKLPDGQRLAVAATWSLSIEHAARLRPPDLARPLLQLAAFLDPNAIPEAVLTSRPARAYLAGHRSRARATDATDESPEQPEVPEHEARLALSTLRRLSLIQHDPTTPQTAVRVHQLLQRAVRDTLTPDQFDETARTAADALLAAWPDVETDTVLAQALRANTAVLTDFAEAALVHPDAHSLLYRTGRSLGEAGQVSAARQYFDRLTSAAMARLGPDHPDTLTARHYLAYWQGEAGDVVGAASSTAELLADRLRVLGPDHPDTLTARHYLAYWRGAGAAGDVAGAAAALAELLADRLRVLGPDHPDTLTTRADLTFWRGRLGDLPGAATGTGELLADRLRVLGPDHPDTLLARHNLAYWRGKSGDTAGAATAFAELLADFLRVLGPDHPSTLLARHNLANWRGEAGDAAGAATAFAELLADSLRVLGPHHPATLVTQEYFAHWRGQADGASGGVR